MTLPQDFIQYTHDIMGDALWQRYLAAFSEESPVSIRLNPWKKTAEATLTDGSTPVPWCRLGCYLNARPNFTLDPLLHAGCYYVQEASSMFLDEVLRQYVNDKVQALDLCAAPGGKSTLIRAALPEGSLLYSNEPDHRRANILMENIQKQGHPDVIVTNNYPRDYKKSKLQFDVILTDVPCSGEGMFRKKPETVSEWSLANVMKCAELQRSIVEDIWPCLKPGGVLIYSTCTFNLHEDEENVRWIMETLGAEILPVAIKPEWNITGSLLKGWDKPVYRFIPGTTKGEGLFMAVLRKPGEWGSGVMNRSPKGLKILSDGCPKALQKGKPGKEVFIPAHAESLLVTLPKDKYPMRELPLEDAQRYLHHESIVLPADAPKGFVIVTYKGFPLGFVKNIGTRANNLYPQEWRIRNLS